MHLLKSPLALVGLLLICVGGGAAIGIATAGNMQWYDTLNKPWWTPPSWLFGPAWTLLYALMAVAMWLVWRAQVNQTNNESFSKRPTVVFALQLLLNFIWTPAFFVMQELGGAMAIIVGLFLAIIATMLLFSKHSKMAVYCLFPYLCWVCFAATLNGGFLWLNR